MGNHKQINEILRTNNAKGPPIYSATQAVQEIENLLQRRLLNQAISLADQAFRKWPSHIALVDKCAQLANHSGRTLAALELLKRAERLGSKKATRQRQAIIDQTAPHWHFRMMNDEIRNQAYDSALRQHVTPDSIVLDIGCGAGLLSMMAVRAGAKHVYACEVHELMHHHAEKIFKLNGYQNKISTIRQVSTQLKIGQQLPEKADIIVAEVFDTGLLGEQALSTFEHAREHLLKPNGKILPCKASVQAVLIESDLLHRESIVKQCSGFKVDSLNELSPSYIQARLDSFPHVILSEVKTIGGFDFQYGPITEKISTIEFTAQTSGAAHGVCFWFTLDFGNQVLLSTGPENKWNCWMQAISTFETPIKLSQGQKVKIDATQTRDRISFKPSSTN